MLYHSLADEEVRHQDEHDTHHEDTGIYDAIVELTSLYIHPEEARHEREWQHEGREDGEVLDRRVGLQFEYALERVLDTVDILLEELDLREYLVQLVLEVLEVELDVVRESLLHTQFYHLQY